ncbi:hypothetical protein QWY82_08140 [Simiduia curdlanivorans]|uniref:Lipoprotein n=1 Tax=Simiduia curdlanivorans TaxID=1492769 RepID=A0ABV8V6D3_9GAMM|nr:hypothetical protein [Simiduia curdlanivorans]MDN3638774.1 hypothetical protein [Simiduia curdlanivorans]
MDSLSIVMHRFTLIFLLLTAMFALGCAERGSFDVYSHKGFSVEFPKSWKFDRDQDFSFNGDREITFKLGEASFVAFYFNDRHDLKGFTDKYLEAAFLKDEVSSTKLKSQKDVNIAGRQGIDSQVTANFLGPMNTRVITVDVSSKTEAVILAAIISEDDRIDILESLERVVSSIRLAN